MKKNILLSSMLFAALFLGVNSAQAAPPPHGAPHGGHQVMYKSSMHHRQIHQPPRMHHHHHVRHSRFISPCHCSYCYPLGLRVHYPLHHGNLGASLYISI